MVGRFLSPDPYVQAPDFSQSFNRYSYAWNNPLKFTDPDGEIIVPLLVGAGISVLSNGISNIANGQGFFNGALKAAAVGGLGGLAGGFGSQFVGGFLKASTTLGGSILNGAITGAAGGFTGGFVGGAANAWLNGTNFGEGLLAGLKGGIIGAGGGAVIGGVSGWLQYSRAARILNRLDDGSITTDAQGRLTPSNETLSEFSETFFKDYKYKDMVNNVYDNEIVSKNPARNAFTQNKLVNGKYNIYYGDGAFSSKMTLFLTMGHEYVHVAHFINIPIGEFSRNWSEAGANQWESHTLSYNKSAQETRFNIRNDWLRRAGLRPNQLTLTSLPRFTPQQYAIWTQYTQFRVWGLPITMPSF